MISVKNLFKSFNGFQVVNGLSFDIVPGEVVGFLGPNGAGKSTTMKMLTGFLLPTSGDIHISDLSFKHSALEIKKKIGYLPEGAPAYGDMTTLQFLSFIARVRGYKGAEKAARIQRVVEQVELQEVLDKPIDILSKGFKRRVGLAQALIHDPEILILDEPTDGLDPNQKYQVRELIKNLSKDKIVIISTHILEEMTAVCNRVMIIARGKLLFDDTLKALNRQSKYYGAVTLHFSYRADASELGELEGVAEMEEDLATGRVTLFPKPGADILHLVTAHAQRCKLPVDSLYVEQGSLEQVFRQITQKNSQEENV
jgi:ABC-2 type transport system ATP-binding protein